MEQGPWAALPAEAAACSTDAQCVAGLQALFAACAARGDCADNGRAAALVGSSSARNRLAACYNGACRCAWGMAKGGDSCLENTAASLPLAAAHACVALLALCALLAALTPLVRLRWRGPLPLRAAESTTLLASAALLLLALAEGAAAAALLLPSLVSLQELQALLAAALLLASMAALRLAGTWAGLAAAARGGDGAGRVGAALRAPAAAYGCAAAWLGATALLAGTGHRAAALGLAAAQALLLGCALATASTGVHFLFQREARPRGCLGGARFFVDALLGAPVLGAPLSSLSAMSLSGRLSAGPESAAALAQKRRRRTRLSSASGSCKRSGSSKSSGALSAPLDSSGALDSGAGGGASMRKFSARVLACAFRLVLALLLLAGCCGAAAAAERAATAAGRPVPGVGRWSLVGAALSMLVALLLACGFFRESYRLRLEQLRASALWRAPSPRTSLSADTREGSADLAASRANGSGASSPASSRSAGSSASPRSTASAELDPAASAAEAVRRHALRVSAPPV